MITPALRLLETAINHALRTDLQTLARLQELENKKIRIDIQDWNFGFFIIPKHNGVELQHKISEEPDTTISGTLANLFRIGLAKDKQHAIKKNKIQFSGDAHIGIAMQQILSKLDIDWEEHLAQRVGDNAAHVISKGAHRLKQFGCDILDSLKRNTTEFIHHEAQLSPTRTELENFYNDITTLRHAVERLEQKIKSC